MKKWTVTLSTTEPFNYVGIVKVRQRNVNSEILQATIVENGTAVNLTNCKVTFQAIVNGYPVERECKIVSLANGIIEYAFDEYTMQAAGKHTANLQISKNAEIINTTQDFSYYVIRAVSKTEAETGSYWQTVEDLINDMQDYLNAGKGEFESWFGSVKEILEDVDPGGILLKEVLEARIDSQGTTHESIKDRLNADFVVIEQRLRKNHYTLFVREVNYLEILQDDDFEIEEISSVVSTNEDGALVICKGKLDIEEAGEVDD